MNATTSASQVMPLRYVASVDAMRAFYLDRLGFEHLMGVVGDDGQLDFCIVQRDGAMMMLSRPGAAGGITQGPVEIYVQAHDVDAFHRELVGRGVAIARGIETQWWGDRNFAVIDPAGHLIWFWQTVAEMMPPPGVRLV